MNRAIKLKTTTKKEHILHISSEKIEQLGICIEPFRVKQIENWFYKNFTFNIEKMTNLPKTLKTVLKASFQYEFPKITESISASDGTKKFLIELEDGEIIEFAIISAINRKTLCLSTQVGCPIKCRFCASGVSGLIRNLTWKEIIAQFMIGSSAIGRAPDNIVFMGIGEPLINYINLVTALDIINDNKKFNYAQRRITISTSGIPSKIRELADIGRQWNLAISLHATNDKIRERVIPNNRSYKISDIIEASKYYYKKSKRIITIEYILIDSVNNKVEHAQELARIAKDLRAKVNLIPYNPTVNSDFKEPSKEEITKFKNILIGKGINATIRMEKGRTVNAACGQLRLKSKKKDN